MQADDTLPPHIKPRHDAKLENPLDWRYEKKTLSDHFANAACKFFRFFADSFFRHRYVHRAIVLETVAAVPGMVGSAFNHFGSLRWMKDDRGRIRTLLDEAENERMHLMTFVELAKPSLLERGLIHAGQAMFVGFFSLAYVFNKRTAHRFVGLMEEEAVKSYTEFLEAIDKGKIKNVEAPDFAKKYWNLPKDAKLRDVVIAVRKDEAEHRDVNHGFADNLDRVKAERKNKSAKEPKAAGQPPAPPPVPA